MIDLIKCKNAACCSELKTPLAFQELALQRQPTPRKDPMREGHFYRRSEARKLFAGDGDAAVFTNLSDLPSPTNRVMASSQKKTRKSKRDTEMAKKLAEISGNPKQSGPLLHVFTVPNVVVSILLCNLDMHVKLEH